MLPRFLGGRRYEIIAGGDGRCDLISGIAHEKGIDFLGPLPAEIQNYTNFSSAVPASAKQADAAKALQAFLAAPAAAPVFRKHGMEPAK